MLVQLIQGHSDGVKDSPVFRMRSGERSTPDMHSCSSTVLRRLPRFMPRAIPDSIPVDGWILPDLTRLHR